MSPLLVNVYALWRDSSEHIQKTLGQLEALTKLDQFRFNFFFYENDSKDDTLERLQEWKRNIDNKAGYVGILSEKLGAPKFGSVPSNMRTAMLSYYRNKNKEMSHGGELSNYSLVLDTDLTWKAETDFLELFGALRFKESTEMVTSNCRQNVLDYVFNQSVDSYYDVYCLRDKWGNGGMYFANTPFYDEADNAKFLSGAPVEIKSGFGGLAMLKSKVFDKVKWSADLHSEHVNFCYDVGNYGKILAVPTSRPFAEIDLGKLNLDNCAEIAKNERQNYENGNQLRKASVHSKWCFGKIE